MQVASQKFSTKNKATNIINSANHNSKPRKQTSKQHRPSTATPFVSSHFIRRRAQQTLYRNTLQNHRKIIGVHQGNLYLKTWFAVRPPHKYRIKQTWWPVTMILLDSKPKPNIFASLPQKFICPHLNYPRNPQPPSNLPPPRQNRSGGTQGGEVQAIFIPHLGRWLLIPWHWGHDRGLKMDEKLDFFVCVKSDSFVWIVTSKN